MISSWPILSQQGNFRGALDTTRLGSSYYSTVTPYSNPYQNMADAFSSLGDTFANIAINEKFMENCMVAIGWRRVEKNAVALTVSAYAIVGSKEAVYEGSATGYPDHTGTIKIKSEDGSVCVGNFRYIDSRGGNGLVRCDDGASAKITFTAITNSSGYGSGTTNQGEVVKFVYGLEGEEKNKFLRTSVGETRALAEQGNPVAVGERNLATIFEKGTQAYERGDYAAALKEWRPLAEQGHAEAQLALGLIYKTGEGVPQNNAGAAGWFREAAEQGHVQAQLMLGYFFAYGEGVPRDEAEAAKWYRLAADKGHADAQHMLGIAYLRGSGVLQDNAQAVKWYRLAAEQGNAHAQYRLAGSYRSGRGVPQDYVRAHKWFNLASPRFPPGEWRDASITRRDQVSAQMTSDQIAKAQRLAREWKPKKGPRASEGKTQ